MTGLGRPSRSRRSGWSSSPRRSRSTIAVTKRCRRSSSGGLTHAQGRREVQIGAVGDGQPQTPPRIRLKPCPKPPARKSALMAVPLFLNPGRETARRAWITSSCSSRATARRCRSTASAASVTAWDTYSKGGPVQSARHVGHTAHRHPAGRELRPTPALTVPDPLFDRRDGPSPAARRWPGSTHSCRSQ